MLDWFLVICLGVLIPARALWKDWRGQSPSASRVSRYVKSGSIILGLLALLGFDWWREARPISALGLDVPLSHGGAIGLIIVAILFALVSMFYWLHKRQSADADQNAVKTRLAANSLFPQNRFELYCFLALTVLIGVGWELLYRGFALWFLVPRVGLVAAICLAAVSYGAAHGYNSRGKFLASLISAFVFTLAYAISHSLWWLMIIHTAMGVVGGVASLRKSNASNPSPTIALTEASN